MNFSFKKKGLFVDSMLGFVRDKKNKNIKTEFKGTGFY